ncbi:hypothetical protein F441_21699 [Phytophthora nicotianae CJ01A1]|uniref:FAM86 N-terminal domain-containing protein n=6 Tax=Phytophthora nicotianae TaxID=4792 RepID=W2QT64_PHYN3|nr:hypothetical protein PPTG_06516 [Phytophthora nicotianae INRA-310]ETI31180.1 hypothetical protein F443_21818 [Phytophthora nicotianae P1569]ETK71583.1 hypothetical protein L915_21212 [Phytophthora nicotianae]ETO59897.1 hypothetical protein F444_21841 [Phytophthora nicotianae P1976]ETP00996.1 hypothetical protein F441_21699 [Phytophthora nicotianae CJ01A1]ETP29138.1 hypothetical protein F442_21678 [Phytophthora nicotianae P10297]KUF81416.1 lysine methyltransferase METTL21B protein [Phytopht
MSDIEDSGEGFWGRTEEREFSYVVTIPSSGEKVSLTAVQDRDICAGTPEFPSHGHCVWDAALLLADYLQTQAQDARDEHRFKGKKVVELGAGVGLVGMTLAVLGAQVALTDQEYALPLLSKNVAVNFLLEGTNKSVATAVAPVVEECQWGDKFKPGGSLTSWKKSTDLIVFSDVLYNASASLLLIKTLHELVSPTTDVIFSFETRNAEIEANFLQELGKIFDVEEVSRKNNAQVFARFEYSDELSIYHARLKAGGNEN